MVLEEQDTGLGVCVESLVDGGAAQASGKVAPGDVLLRIGDAEVGDWDFDRVMAALQEAPASLSLTLSDGLGRLDITPNLAKSLSAEDAVLADAVVRQAVREIRADGEAQRELGVLRRVEILLGAGVREDGRCLVRFFAIFSTGGSSSYSCNVSATGRRAGADGAIEISALSCAKDEGWGRTIDLKREG